MRIAGVTRVRWAGYPHRRLMCNRHETPHARKELEHEITGNDHLIMIPPT